MAVNCESITGLQNSPFSKFRGGLGTSEMKISIVLTSYNKIAHKSIKDSTRDLK